MWRGGEVGGAGTVRRPTLSSLDRPYEPPSRACAASERLAARRRHPRPDGLTSAQSCNALDCFPLLIIEATRVAMSRLARPLVGAGSATFVVSCSARWSLCWRCVSERQARYRIVSISLYSHEAHEADRLTEVLRRAGWPRANRSLVVREALGRLSEDLAGKSPDDIFAYFLDRQTRRLTDADHPSPSSPDASAHRDT